KAAAGHRDRLRSGHQADDQRRAVRRITGPGAAAERSRPAGASRASCRFRHLIRRSRSRAPAYRHGPGSSPSRPCAGGTGRDCRGARPRPRRRAGPVPQGGRGPLPRAGRRRRVRRPDSGGPGPARNTALRMIGTALVAFLDSDCIPPPGWISALTGHFADPLVAAAAPRIVGTDQGVSALDLGDRPARVAPLTRVAYVPTAALLLRRSALGDGFDEALRYGEDVDLVWRLIEAGWRVRYEPSVQVAHREPRSRPDRLRRRFRYGTSAAPLTRRHPGSVTPLVLQPWPAGTMAALLARRPLAAGAAFTTSTVLLVRRLSANGLPTAGVVRPMAGGVWRTWLGTGRWCGQYAAPALLLVLARPGGRTPRIRWGRRLAAASLLAGPPLAQWARGPEGSPLSHTADALADAAAYGAGVYAGCLRERLISPVLPVIAWKPFEGLRRRRDT